MGIFKKDQTPEAALAELTDANKLLSEENAQLKASVAALEQSNAKLVQENETFDAVNKELMQKIGEMSDIKKVTSGEIKPAPLIGGKEFSLEGSTYGFNYPKTTIKKMPVTVDDVIASVDLQRQLVQTNSSMIYKK